jgi:peptidoglycan/LPS O-acetylase OafA/YrhL
MQKQKIFFPNLDGLRFFSFLLVFFAHSFNADNPLIKQENWYKIIKVRMFTDGDIGVSFFFVLSGFLISYLLLKEKEITNTIDVKSFYIRRILRIWPLYYLMVIFGFFIFPVLKTFFGQVPNETADPLLCSTFLNNFDRMHHIPDASALAILWSVAIEEQFYLIWPLLLFFIKSDYYKYLFLNIIFLSTLFRVLFIHQIAIDVHTIGVIADMAIGGLGAFLVLNSSGFLKKIINMPKSMIIIPYILTIVFIIFKNEIFYTDTMTILKRVIMASSFILIILEQNYSLNSFFKVGNWKTVSRLGKYTYGLYCLHEIGILLCLTLLRKFSLNHSSWQLWFLEIPISMFFSILLSWFSFTYFESWFLKKKLKFSLITKE